MTWGSAGIFQWHRDCVKQGVQTAASHSSRRGGSWLTSAGAGWRGVQGMRAWGKWFREREDRRNGQGSTYVMHCLTCGGCWEPQTNVQSLKHESIHIIPWLFDRSKHRPIRRWVFGASRGFFAASLSQLAHCWVYSWRLLGTPICR